MEPVIVPGSPLDKLMQGGVPTIAWVAAGIMLLLLIASVDQKIGGWLIIVVVVSMVFKAHDPKRGLL